MENKKDYMAPSVEVVEFQIERGFVGSGQGTPQTQPTQLENYTRSGNSWNESDNSHFN